MCGGVSRGHNRDQPLELWVRTYLLQHDDDYHHDHDDCSVVDESIKFKFSIGIWVGPKSEEDPPLSQVVANIVTSNHRAIVRQPNYLHTNNAQTTMIVMMIMMMILLVLSEQNYPLHQLNHNQAQEGSASAQEVSSSSTGSSTNQTRPRTCPVL